MTEKPKLIYSLCQTRGERYLWRAVIWQAFSDATNGKDESEQKSSYDRDQAKQWLLHNNQDFIDVCSYASLNPHDVREQFLRYRARKQSMKYIKSLAIIDEETTIDMCQ